MLGPSARNPRAVPAVSRAVGSSGEPVTIQREQSLEIPIPDFHLVFSHNPGYQSLMKDLKPSTKQRFGALDFNYPERAIEAEIVVHESGVAGELADKLVSIAERARNLKGHGLDEGISTRMLVHAGSLTAINTGIEPRRVRGGAPA